MLLYGFQSKHVKLYNFINKFCRRQINLLLKASVPSNQELCATAHVYLLLTIIYCSFWKFLFCKCEVYSMTVMCLNSWNISLHLYKLFTYKLLLCTSEKIITLISRKHYVTRNPERFSLKNCLPSHWFKEVLDRL